MVRYDGKEPVYDPPVRCAGVRGTTNLIICVALPGTGTIRITGTTTSVFELFALIMPVSMCVKTHLDAVISRNGGQCMGMTSGSFSCGISPLGSAQTEQIKQAA